MCSLWSAVPPTLMFRFLNDKATTSTDFDRLHSSLHNFRVCKKVSTLTVNKATLYLDVLVLKLISPLNYLTASRRRSGCHVPLKSYDRWIFRLTSQIF